MYRFWRKERRVAKVVGSITPHNLPPALANLQPPRRLGRRLVQTPNIKWFRGYLDERATNGEGPYWEGRDLPRVITIMADFPFASSSWEPPAADMARRSRSSAADA